MFRVVEVFRDSLVELELMDLKVLRVLLDPLQVVILSYFIIIMVVLVVLVDSLGMELHFPSLNWQIDMLEVIVILVIITMQFIKKMEHGHHHSQI